jgi:hypothetical protein
MVGTVGVGLPPSTLAALHELVAPTSALVEAAAMISHGISVKMPRAGIVSLGVADLAHLAPALNGFGIDVVRNIALDAPSCALVGAGADWDLAPFTVTETWLRYLETPLPCGSTKWVSWLADAMRPRIKDLVRWASEHGVDLNLGDDLVMLLAELRGAQVSVRFLPVAPADIAGGPHVVRLSSPHRDMGGPFFALPRRAHLDGNYIAHLVMSAPHSSRRLLLTHALRLEHMNLLEPRLPRPDGDSLAAPFSPTDAWAARLSTPAVASAIAALLRGEPALLEWYLTGSPATASRTLALELGLAVPLLSLAPSTPPAAQVVHSSPSVEASA